MASGQIFIPSATNSVTSRGTEARTHIPKDVVMDCGAVPPSRRAAEGKKGQCHIFCRLSATKEKSEKANAIRRQYAANPNFEQIQSASIPRNRAYPAGAFRFDFASWSCRCLSCP